MAEPLSPGRSPTALTDLDIDTLTRCVSFLNVRDISNMAMSCRYLNSAAYSDSIWLSLYRQEWPLAALPCCDSALSMRRAYLSRHAAIHQFKFIDPLYSCIPTVGKAPHSILFDKRSIIYAQGSSICSICIDDLINGSAPITARGNHNARITCMRLFSSSEMCLTQKESERDDNILVTSSNDHFIRLWSKGGSRCYKGHTGPVCTLSDKLLGDGTGKVFASGGEDGTVRLWSINSSGKRGQHALKATLHGHDKAVSLMSVAGHKTSLLVSLSKNGKVRVWDTNSASTSIRSSCCVGMTSASIAPVDMKCHESLIYVAASSSVIAVDLRTMCRVLSICQSEKIQSFGIVPSKSALCTGGTGRAMLWDVRRVSNTTKPEPTVELNGHLGPVKLVHMDTHKVITGGPDDSSVRVWEADTGAQTNLVTFAHPDGLPDPGCSAMAVDGCRIVIATGVQQENACLHFQDFMTATYPVSSDQLEESVTGSKFWDPQLDDDADDPEDPVWL